jgi:hypothetical protein
MVIGNVFTLTPDLKQFMADAMDDGIANFGKTCLLVYPQRATQCPNCVWDSLAKKSKNIYKPGGPIPFTTGLCPVCGGNGLINEVSKTVPIKMIVEWNPKSFLYLIPTNTIQMPYGSCETLGYMSDIPSILQSRVMYVELPIVPIIRGRFELASEPTDPHSIAQGLFFRTAWKRIG